jgi:hypothetical protein
MADTVKAGRLSVDLRDSSGQPIRSKTLLLLAENKPALANQFRLESDGRENISADFPPGPYSLQVFPVGFEVGRAFANIRSGQTTDIKLTLRPAPEPPKPTLKERLAVYGLSPDQLKLSSLTVAAGQRIVLDFRRFQDKSAFSLLRPISVDDIKRWHGTPDRAFGHDQPRFGNLPLLPEGASPFHASLSTEGLNSVAREYIYGNSKSVVKFANLINEFIKNLDIVVSIFHFIVVTIDAGAILEIGNGSSVFFADVLRIHKRGTLSVVGDMRVDVGQYEQFG